MVEKMTLVALVTSVDSILGLLLRVEIQIKEPVLIPHVCLLSGDDFPYIGRHERSWRDPLPLIENHTPALAREPLDLQREHSSFLRRLGDTLGSASALGIALPQKPTRLL